MQISQSKKPLPNKAIAHTPTRNIFTELERALADLLTLASQVMGLSITGICLSNGFDEWTTFSDGSMAGQINEVNVFFNYIKEHACDLEIQDTSHDERFNSDNWANDFVQVRYFKSICLFNKKNDLAGFLFLMDESPAALVPRQEDCLKILQAQLLSLLDHLFNDDIQIHAEIAAVANQILPGLQHQKTVLEDVKKAAMLAGKLKENIENKYPLDYASIVAITDEAGIINYVNDNFCKISKFSREELIGQDHRIINSGYHDKAFIKNLWTTISSGKIWKGELKNKAKDGTTYWVNAVIVPFVNEAGKPYQYVAIRSDITQAKLSEANVHLLNETLLKNEQKLRVLIEYGTDIIMLLDINLNTLYRSPSAKRITGWDDDEIIGKKNTWERIHRDDVAGLQLDLMNVLKSSGSTQNISFRTAHKKGHYIWLEGTITNLLLNLVLNGIIFNLRDVTGAKAAAALLSDKNKQISDILERIPYGFIIFNPLENKFIHANKKISALLGYTAEELHSMNFTSLMLQQTGDDNITGLTLQGKIKNISIEQALQCKDGARVEVELSVILMPDQNYICFIRDITEHKKAALEILQLNQRLQQNVIDKIIQLETANKDLETFSYSVSHDLRSPLRAINGYASIIEEDYGSLLDQEGNRLLKELRKNANKMGALIDDLLTFSRMGRKNIMATSINMNGLCITAFDEIDEGNKSKIEFILDPLPTVMADYALIKQVLINLLSNAIKYSSKNLHPKITVSSKIDKDENEVIYSIKDNGAGFDMKYVNKLFGVFQRLHSNDEFEGTGVGLATVQRIIYKHGGRVWAESVLNEGASFYFTLPLKNVN